MKNFDISIIGGGHAGVEAAWIASQFDLQISVFIIPGVSLASAPCNPAIGGVGKGQVVRELDALGGLMGKLADLSAIQYRTLNDSKGYAVRSTRAQIDKEIYSSMAEKIINNKQNISVIRHKVISVKKQLNGFEIYTESGELFTSSKVIVTTGTFLDGKLHCGEEISAGGRFGNQSAPSLNDIFSNVKTLGVRFKTGTPPRLLKETIDFTKMEEQPSDKSARNFHALRDPFEREQEQRSCFLTRTAPETLKIIRENRDKSPIFNGQIKGIGPRYCPSIEDKAYRYPDRDSHHVFIEPEGLSLDTFYPNGVSTSLPKSVQKEFLQTMPGLENVEIAIYGYAVEYDVVDTSQLNETLEYADISGLYFAGQVNGTSGYEEAAGQGFVAGLNASLSAQGRDAFVLDRNDSYIGVMVEDLITSQRDEPYRLFTARSENRLKIREDNVFDRMFKYRQSLKLKSEIDDFYGVYMLEKKILEKIIKEYSFDGQNCFNVLKNTKLEEVLKRPDLDPVDVLEKILKNENLAFNHHVVYSVAISAKYDGYIKRGETANSKLSRYDKRSIDWEKICSSKNISNECKQRIQKIRPTTFLQLKKIEGLRPATLVYVAGQL